MASLFGEKNPSSVLTKAAVKEMRMLRKKHKHTYSLLADEFGISERQVRRVVSGENWAKAGK